MNVFELSPREFSAFLEEERQYRTPEQIDDLMRRYNQANSLSGRLSGLLAPQEGRRRATFFPASVPEGMSLFDAFRAGEADFAVPQGIVDMVVGGVQGVENPGLAAQGRIPAADMETAALQTAGTAMAGGGAVAKPAVAKPASALGANTLRSGKMTDPLVASDVSARGDQILNMLKSGRGSEVTDAMLDMGDGVKNTQLNQYLAANYDLPMDEASRLARAREMGFNVDDVQYHGTAPSIYSDDNFSPDITAFIPGVKGQLGAGVYVAPDVRKANKFASAGEVNRGDFDPNKAVPKGGSVLPVYIRSSNPASYGEMRNAQYGLENVSGFNDLSMRGTQALSDEGFTGVRTGNEENVFDPNNIRSTNARFDPRLSELENILAANASPISGLLAQSGVSSEQAQRIEDYLYRTGLLQ